MKEEELLGTLHERTLDSLVAHHAETIPDSIALVDSTGSMSWGELESAVDRLAGVEQPAAVIVEGSR